MADKLTPNQLRRIAEIESYLKTVAFIRTLVHELEQNRAARALIVQNLTSQIAREFSQLRQKSLTSNVGTLPDVAGQLSLVAGRSVGMQVKLRALNEGLAGLGMQLDQALKAAHQPEPRPSAAQPRAAEGAGPAEG